jgi:hypothetical protein
MVARMKNIAFRCPICSCTSFERIASATQHRRAVFACSGCSALFADPERFANKGPPPGPPRPPGWLSPLAEAESSTFEAGGDPRASFARRVVGRIQSGSVCPGLVCPGLVGVVRSLALPTTMRSMPTRAGRRAGVSPTDR